MTEWLLDPDYSLVDLIEGYESFIWTERYYACGDFELYLPTSAENFKNYTEDRLLYRSDSDRLMIVEDVKLTTDREDGNWMTVTGRSLESILERRIVWGRQSLSGNLQNGIFELLVDHAINPADPSRKIPGLRFLPSTNPKVTTPTVDVQLFGDNLYETLIKLLKEFNIGFRITMPVDGDLVFELYAGEDRSGDQLTNPQVTFSPNFDNLVGSSYFKSKRAEKSVALIVGEGEGDAQKVTATNAPSGVGQGFGRRELFVDSSSLKSEIDGVITPDNVYYDQLRLAGKLELLNHRTTTSFDGEIINLPNLQYSKDFYMGDIVQIENEYGWVSTSRISEFIRSNTATGETVYPTLEKI